MAHPKAKKQENAYEKEVREGIEELAAIILMILVIVVAAAHS